MNILITGKPQHFEKDSHSAQAFYRFLYPFKELTRVDRSIQVKESTSAFMPELGGIDICLFHTPTNHGAIEAMAHAYEAGKKVWVDFDDLVFADYVPSANLAKSFFTKKNNQDALAASLVHADVVTVSTETIKENIVSIFKYPAEKIYVIHNALPDEVWDRRAKFRPFTKPTPKDPARVMWRGSITHIGDLMLNKDGFKPFPNVAYQFYGAVPFMLEKRYGGHLEEYTFRDWDKGLFQYFAALKQMNPDYMVVPLEDCAFNHAKSNISWLEATLAGGVCISQDSMPEFSRTPGPKFDTPKSLERMFRAINDGEDMRYENYMLSRSLIEREYLYSHTNRQRLDIINSL